MVHHPEILEDLREEVRGRIERVDRLRAQVTDPGLQELLHRTRIGFGELRDQWLEEATCREARLPEEELRWLGGIRILMQFESYTLEWIERSVEALGPTVRLVGE